MLIDLKIFMFETIKFKQNKMKKNIYLIKKYINFIFSRKEKHIYLFILVVILILILLINHVI